MSSNPGALLSIAGYSQPDRRDGAFHPRSRSRDRFRTSFVPVMVLLKPVLPRKRTPNPVVDNALIDRVRGARESLILQNTCSDCLLKWYNLPGDLCGGTPSLISRVIASGTRRSLNC
jgi:hypothetical protein